MPERPWTADETTYEGMKQRAEFLFNLLDDIDTVSDMAKSDDAAYRDEVERIQRKRYQAADTDGYGSILWDSPALPHPAPEQPPQPLTREDT